MCSRAGCRPTRPRRSRRRRRRLRPSNSPSARSCDTYKPASNRATPGGHLVDSCLRRRPRAALRPRELRVPAAATQTAREGWTHTVRGVFKKFAAQPRRKTNFRTQRGVRDVTLLKRPLTQPLANRSSCFAQDVGCCKNVCYFCRTQRRSAGSSDSIRSVTEKCHKGYPRILVGNTGGMLSSL